MGVPYELLPTPLAALIVDELVPGESVTWIGQPDPGRHAWKGVHGVWIGIPFAAMGLALLIVPAAFKDHSDSWMPFVMGPIFLLVGLAAISAPYWKRRAALRTAYVITNRRVLIFEGKAWQGVNIRSFPPNRFNVIHRTQYADGTGDLIFHCELLKAGDGDSYRSEVGFFSIADVKEVEALVRKLTIKKVGVLPYNESARDGFREPS